MKVYLFYLKSDKSLYAFTNRKDYMKRFKKERNQKHYHYVKKELDPIQYQAISYSNRGCILFDNVLNDESFNDLSYLTTYHENDMLENYLSELEKEIYDINRSLEEYNLKDKYMELFYNILLYYKKEENPGISITYTLNIFRIFVNLFKDVIL